MWKHLNQINWNTPIRKRRSYYPMPKVSLFIWFLGEYFILRFSTSSLAGNKRRVFCCFWCFEVTETYVTKPSLFTFAFSLKEIVLHVQLFCQQFRILYYDNTQCYCLLSNKSFFRYNNNNALLFLAKETIKTCSISINNLILHKISYWFIILNKIKYLYCF